MAKLNVCPIKEARKPEPFVKTMGSGWFWCHRGNDWIVCYINASWGALVDGYYVRTDNFDAVVGPLEAPDYTCQLLTQGEKP